MATAYRITSTSARTHHVASKWTRLAARSTVTVTAYPTTVMPAPAPHSAALTERGMAAVARVAEYLGQSDTRLRIVAHTDSQGAAAYNQQLSERRAASVMEALIAEGVEPSRLESQGRGEEEPIADNSTAEGRQQNRRVEFIVLEDGVLEDGE